MLPAQLMVYSDLVTVTVPVLRDTRTGGVGHTYPQLTNANFGGRWLLLLTLGEHPVVCPVLVPETRLMAHGSEYRKLRKLYG